MHKMLQTAFGAAVAVGLSLTASGALAQATYTGSSGSRAASVSFEDVGGGVLQVTLTNTSTADALVPVDILTGVFFEVGVTLTRLSANVAPGSVVLFPPGGFSGTDVGGEWAYRGDLSQYGVNGGISSSGLGLFGPGDTFPPQVNLSGPDDPDGLQFGITTAGDNSATGNTPVTGTNALIKNSVVFQFSGLPTAFDLQSIGNVTFQYGTSLTEPSFTTDGCVGPGCRPDSPPEVAEPLSIAMFGAGLLGLGLARRRFRKAA